MEEISKVAQGNAAAIEEVSATARSQQQALGATLGNSEALAGLAEELRGALGSFRTDVTETVSDSEAERDPEAGPSA